LKNGLQYKIAESPVPSEDEEEESEDEDDGFGPKKPAVDPDDPVAREFSPEMIRKLIMGKIMMINLLIFVDVFTNNNN